MNNEWCRVQRMSPEEANRWYAELMAWIDKNQKHIELQDAIVYWRNAFWDLMFNKRYGPNSHLLVELEQYRELNQRQAGRIMELEFDIRCLKRVHDSKIRGD